LAHSLNPQLVILKGVIHKSWTPILSYFSWLIP